MGIHNVTNFDLNTISQENKFLTNIKSVSPSVVQDKLVTSLSDSFKSVLSADSKREESGSARIRTERANNLERRDVSEKESDVDEVYRAKAEKVSPATQLGIHDKLPKGMTSVVGNVAAVSPVTDDSLIVVPSFDVAEADLMKEDLDRSANSFEFTQDVLQQDFFEAEGSMSNGLPMPVGFSESMVAQNTVKQINQASDGALKIEHDSDSLLNSGDVQISIGSERAAAAMQSDQRIDPAVLRNLLTDQQVGAPKMIVSVTLPTQTIAPLITPMLILYDDSMNKGLLGAESDVSIDIESVPGKPISFVDASQHQKQLLSKQDRESYEEDPEQSFSGSDGQAQKVSSTAADLAQRTAAVQKLTQIIKDRAQDAIDKSKGDIALNVKGIQTNIGEVELDFKITNRKVSVRFLSDSKDMQALLNQERSNIVSILNGLIGSNSEFEYMLADMPVEICHKERKSEPWRT